MWDYIEIGPSPVEESCAQLGTPGYSIRARIECRIFKEQLIRQFGPPPEGAYLTIKSFLHDFGTYYEVVCKFKVDNKEALEYALKLEGETPLYWDEIAKKQLKEAMSKLRCSYTE